LEQHVTKRPQRLAKPGRSTPTVALASASRTRKTDDAQPVPVAEQKPRPAAGIPDVTIVGIGASAGGLAAFEAFFSAMPADTEPGIAFVLVQHLAPDHKSILSDLVRRYTAMKVFDVEDGMHVQPNCAYIIPPNRDMAVLNGTLHLLEPAAPRGLRLPIDFFFRSLAQDQHDRAICIVLSGTGSDGTLGARAIKGEGGMVMVQAPESTEYDGMPRSVMATGLVDYVLPPAEMPAQLIAFTARRFGGADVQESSAAQHSPGALQRILVLLRAHTGHDFSLYKQRTVLRRIERRMAVHQIEGLADYARYMQDAPAESDALFGDLLIGVTSFFRDTDAFKAFEEQVIAHAFDDKPAGTKLRVWVAGCSTGEEAYSIAILLQERILALKQNFKVQFFATDVDRRAIDVARAGVYPANIAADVSAERLARFFVQDPADGTYRIHKTLRDMLVFSEQDVIKDPPFSRLDVISCRNMLIYMGPELHQKLIPLFHYALSPNGVLFLGTSETVGEFGDLFAALDRKSKLYRRKEGDLSMQRPAIESFLPPMFKGQVPRPVTTVRSGTVNRLRELTEQALLKQGHIGALVNERGDLLYLHGRSGHYFELAPGEAGMNLLKMAREGLRRDLATALHKATVQKAPVRHSGLVVKTNGSFNRVNLTVRPAEAGPAAVAEPGLFVVILEDAPAPDATSAPTAALVAGEATEAGSAGNLDADARISALKRELQAKEAYLQTSNEELATSNEELKSSNEEMQSVNEELQSANEELETSKEELQSMNEELATVNAELQTKMADLSRANNDLNNLLAGTGMGTVFVDHQLRIQRFTPAITQIINLIQSDLGRPVGHLASNLIAYDSLVTDIQAVLDSLTPKEVEVQTQQGAWFLLRIRPYRTLDNVIEGAVITFTDITDMKKAREALLESEGLRRLAVVVRDSHDAILVQGLDGRIVAWNPAAVRTYGWSEAEALTMNIRELIPEDKRELALAKVHEVAGSEVLEPYRAQRLAKGGAIIELWLTAARLVNERGEPYAIATTERAMGKAKP
jgi:two-component system CheB/CheR fusion protein